MWRENWSERPLAWVNFAALTVAWLLLAIFAEFKGRSGWAWLLPAAVSAAVAVYVYRAARASSPVE